jgi:hypothetical protein
MTHLAGPMRWPRDGESKAEYAAYMLNLLVEAGLARTTAHESGAVPADAHWLVTPREGGEAFVVRSESSACFYCHGGWRVEGPFVPACHRPAKDLTSRR